MDTTASTSDFSGGPGASTAAETRPAWGTADTLHAAGVGLLAVALAGSIALFGGVTEGGRLLLWAFGVPGSLLVLAGAWRGGRLLAPGLPEYLLLAGVAFAFLQAFPLPSVITRALAPEAARWHDILGDGGAGSLSASPSLTFRSALFGVLLVAIYLAGRQAARWTAGRWALPLLIVALGVADAIYGLFERYAREVPTILGVERTSFVDCVTGTFINRNHFAALLVVSLPMAIVLLWRVIVPEEEEIETDEPTYDEYLARHKPLARRLVQPAALALFAAIALLAASTLLSRSRMGTAALAVAGLITLAQIPWLEGLFRFQRLASGVLAAMVIVLFVALLGGGLGARFKQLAVGGEMARRTTWEQTLGLASTSPLTGLGLGTYPSVFQRYAVLEEGLYVYHAHSDILELLAEAGLVGVVLVGGFLVVLIGGFVALIRRYEESGVSRYIALACVAGLTGLVCCLSVDFPLQMPGLVALAALVAGALRGATEEAEREAILILEEHGQRFQPPMAALEDPFEEG